MTSNYQNINYHHADYQNIDYQNIEKTMSRIFLSVIFSWNQLRENEEVMNILNMNTNNMCRHIKNTHPNLRDQFIQAYVLSFLLVLFLVVCVPMQNLLVSYSQAVSEIFVPDINTSNVEIDIETNTNTSNFEIDANTFSNNGIYEMYSINDVD